MSWQGIKNAASGVLGIDSNGKVSAKDGSQLTNIISTTATNISGGATNNVLYQTAASTTGFLTTTNNSLLGVNGSGVPAFTTTLPSAVKIANGGSLTNVAGTGIIYNTPTFTWTTSGAVLPSAAAWSSIAFGQYSTGTFVAVASGSTSSVYSRAIYSKWTSGGALPSAAAWSSIAYGNGAYVTTATGGTQAAYSRDGGLSWVASTLPSSHDWGSVIYGDNTFVTVSSNASNATAYSTDGGVSWIAGGSLPSSGNWYSVAFGNHTFVTIKASSTDSAYSTDGGITWTLGGALPTIATWSAIASGVAGTAGLNSFVVVSNGAAGAAAYSTDNGLTWTASTLPTTGNWFAVTYAYGVFVAIQKSTTAAAYSFDGGATWIAATLPSASDWNGLAYGNGLYVAIVNGATNNAYGYYANAPQLTPTAGNSQILNTNSLYGLMPETFNPVIIKGKWNPVLSGWTNVGTPTVTGTYTLSGNLVYVSIQIVPSTSVSSTALTSSITGLPYAVATDFDGVLGIVDTTTSVGLENAYAKKATSSIFVPTISATGDTLIISGVYSLS